ncbi:hypothetical protein PIB30_086136 [Stylosanthes scabra]|uniref:Non-specific serine/threonine protein kinase n=1 Tax=Stylosanthes scabra TaxID=79078 RepID=A0ABU6QTR2_9FABA|nr:hypothetical protein [Stylosanthes scabra]
MADSITRDTIDTLKSISDGETLVSADETFALGFFSPGTSKNRYVGIWYNKVPKLTVVWVANRNKPLTDSSGLLTVNNTGILQLLNHNKTVIWSSNTTRPAAAQHPIAKLLNSGNFIVQEKSNNNNVDEFLWQSFDYPCDTLLPGQKFGRNLVTGLNRYLSSWKSSDDPSPGRYNSEVDVHGFPQMFIRDGTVKRYRVGSWNGVQFSGRAPQWKKTTIFRINFVVTEEEVYYIYELLNNSVFHKVMLTPDGFSLRSTWNDEKMDWIPFAKLPVDDCDYYATCGAYAVCNTNTFPLCDCLDYRFVQKTEDISSGGCVRRTALNCREDGFLKYSSLKLPDTDESWYNRSINLDDCRDLCLKNCSCTAYSPLDVSNGTSGCLLWFGNLKDMKQLSTSLQDIYIRMARTELGTLFIVINFKISSDCSVFPNFSVFLLTACLEAIEGNKSNKSQSRKQETIIIGSTLLSFGVLILCLAFIFYRRKRKQNARQMKQNQEARATSDHHDRDLELPLFDISTITSATNNFSTDNILGKGGFGSVYKGILEDGKEIAVKRLSQNSQQGLQEFKNEVMHVAKLQHRNLVKLLGCCIQAEERLLVYEFMPNKSLDFFIFDEKKGMLLDWPARLHIINGIARGLLYLHQDSRHRIIHRDLKAANVLLDDEMNPKISDFGLARSFGGNEAEANTQHVVGT